MRIMFLKHRGMREINLEHKAKIVAQLNSYASKGTTVELHYPEDLGGDEIRSKLHQHENLSGLHHILETPALVKKIIEAGRSGFDAGVQNNTFDPGLEAAR